MRELQRKLWTAARQSSERRFHALYDRVHRGDVLWEAWRRVLNNRGAAGVDRITLAQVEEYGVERMLRGWGNYFRTGNAADKFTQVDRYVAWRLRRLMIKKRGRNLRAGQAQQWTRDWFEGLGLYRLSGTIRYPKAA